MLRTSFSRHPPGVLGEAVGGLDDGWGVAEGGQGGLGVPGGGLVARLLEALADVGDERLASDVGDLRLTLQRRGLGHSGRDHRRGLLACGGEANESVASLSIGRVELQRILKEPAGLRGTALGHGLAAEVGELPRHRWRSVVGEGREAGQRDASEHEESGNRGAPGDSRHRRIPFCRSMG